MQNNRFSGLSQRKKKTAAKQNVAQAHTLEVTTPGPATNARAPQKLRASTTAPEFRRPTTTITTTTTSRTKRLEDELDTVVDAALCSFRFLEYEYENEEDQLLVCAPEETTVLVAADTGAVDHVIPVSALPRGCVPDGVVERHFVGANDAHIEAYGGGDTRMTTREGQIACAY